jgi:ribonuclease BN (tRNA processing enzyme)
VSEAAAALEARFVGAHQAESADLHFTTILIDRTLAIDAGGLASGLPLADQLAIENVLLTHRHWDHLKDLPALGFNVFSAAEAGCGVGGVDLWSDDDVLGTVRDLMLTSRFWMDFFAAPHPDKPVFRHRPIRLGAPFQVGDYTVDAIPINHGPPTTGYQVADRNGRRLYYTSDNGPGCGEHWATACPDVLVTECTFSNAQRELEGGRMHGHLCPSQLQIELETFRDRRGYVPRVFVVHVNPFYEVAIRPELADVARSVGVEIVIATEGDAIQV